MSEVGSDTRSSDRIIETAISRRDLLRRVLAVGLVTPAMVSLLAACGDDAGDEPAAGAPDDATNEEDERIDGVDDDAEQDDPEGTSSRGGILRIALNAPPENFHPHHNHSFESTWPNSQIYSRLTRVTHDMELEPDLASSWAPSDDGLTWTFEIRDGVKFHNGEDCTAVDAMRSYERLLDPEEGVPVRSQYEMIESVEAPSDTELIFNLSSVYADFAAILAGARALVFPVDLTESLTLEPVGSGPYRLKQLQAGERAVLERFDEYFDLDNQAFVDEIHYISIPEETSRITALTGGAIDIIPEIRPSVLPTVENVEGIEFDEIVTGGYQPIVMDASREPFSDNRVRAALKLCAQRDEIIQATRQGHGETATDHPIASIDPMWADIGIPEQNHERARELLAEAGYPDGIDIELHTSPGRPGMQEVALSIQEMAAPAGFRIEVVNHPIDAYWADVWMNRTFTISNWNSYPVADMALSVAYLSDSAWNESFWQNEQLDELVMLGRETLDEDERLEIYREIQELMAAESASLISYFATVIGAWSSRVKGHRLHPLQFLEPNWVWLEEGE